VDLNQLNGPQRKILREAFVSAFDENSLDDLVQSELNKPPLLVMVRHAALWKMTADLINASQREGWTSELVTAAQRTSRNPRLASLVTALRIGDLEGDLRLPGGSLELMVREKAGLPDFTIWVNELADISRWVCRIEYPTAAGGVGYGTGVLVAPDLVLTNYHVVERHERRQLQAKDIRCRFDYSVGVKATPGSMVSLAPSWLAGFSRYSEYDPGDQGGAPLRSELDYALLRLCRSLADDALEERTRGHLRVSAATPPPRSNDIVLISQHPQGGPLKIGIGVVSGSNPSGTRLMYDANTLEGSSGSPCFDANLNLVALHHGGDPNWRSPEYNQGIPISLIIEALGVEGSVTPFWT
jgi:Trypsin-like peptidase domain/Effector-associated domain 1